MKYKYLLLALILLCSSFVRLWKLNEVPVSLFGDELDVGYHAYSILKTGKDYSGNAWPLHFQSLAEWRTPLYLYSAVPTVALFGISPWGVRLPAAVFGIISVFGIYLLVKELFNNFNSNKNGRLGLESSEILGLLSAFIMAFSPWHIQYSRAGFEVTMLLAFLIFGLYFFFISIRESDKKSKSLLWLSTVLLISTPLIYSTAKLFTPLLLTFLLILFRQEVFNLDSKIKKTAIIAALIVGIPTAYATLYSGGTQRFGYISVFTDPTIEFEVGANRHADMLITGDNSLTTFTGRFFHNKVIFWLDKVSGNYFESFSTQFLFINGDLNLRHSIEGIGMFYKIEALALLLGMVLLLTIKNKRVIILLIFWLFFGIIPSAITRDGGGHATRLILILPPIVIIMSYGLYKTVLLIEGVPKYLFVISYLGVFVLSFIFYQHLYWVHNPIYSERWWHTGFQESIQYIRENHEDYDRIIITSKDEPPWIFFAGWWEFPPHIWQENKPDQNWSDMDGFGRVTSIDKFYFGTVNSDIGLYGLSDYIDEKTLYMAYTEEIGANLIREPERTPPDLELLKSVAYPSGEPAFYIFRKK